MNNDIKRGIIDALRLGEMPEVEQERAISELTSHIIENLMLKVARRLTAEQSAELEGLLNSGQDDQVLDFLRQTLPDWDDLVQESSREIIASFPQRNS